MKTVELEHFKNGCLFGTLALWGNKELVAETKLVEAFGVLSGYPTTSFVVYKNDAEVSNHLDLKLAIKAYNEI